MELALDQARIALELGEVPVGCVFTLDDKVIAQGHNRTNVDGNATRHAEIVAMLGCSRPELLVGSTLYVTCEPCAMCASAIQLAGVARVVYGCHNERFGGCGSAVHIYTQYSVVPLVMHEEAVQLFREFYARGNPNGEFFF
jgi:tRNA-specific adenosine deaminase 2